MVAALDRAERRRREKLAKKAGRGGVLDGPQAALLKAGFQHHQAGNLEAAEQNYRQVLEASPNHPDANHLLGLIAHAMGAYDGAVHHMAIALKESPKKPAYHNNIGLAQLELGEAEEARASFARAIKLEPDYALAHNNLGTAYLKLDRPDDALKSFRRAAEAEPTLVEAQENLGNACKEMELWPEAEAGFRRVLEIQPDHADARKGLAIAQRATGRMDDSLESFETALEHHPDNADLHYNYALTLLATGDLEKGWAEYEWRYRAAQFAPLARGFSQPQWDGSNLTGKRILLWAEQVLGDEIRYAGMITDVMKLGSDVSIECELRLVDLFVSSFPEASVFPRPYDDGETAKANFDYQCSFPSLAQYMRPTIVCGDKGAGAWLTYSPPI